jgi:hypothetical protein
LRINAISGIVNMPLVLITGGVFFIANIKGRHITPKSLVFCLGIALIISLVI